MKVIRYSNAFKMQAVREVESGESCAHEVQSKYDIKGTGIGVELTAAGVKMGRDWLFEELRKAGLLVERKPSEWPRTTHFNPTLNLYNYRRPHAALGFRMPGMVHDSD